MPNIQLTGNQSDFLKIVASAAGRGDLEIVRQLVDDNPAWITPSHRRFTRSDDAVGSGIPGQVGGRSIPL